MVEAKHYFWNWINKKIHQSWSKACLHTHNTQNLDCFVFKYQFQIQVTADICDNHTSFTSAEIILKARYASVAFTYKDIIIVAPFLWNISKTVTVFVLKKVNTALTGGRAFQEPIKASLEDNHTRLLKCKFFGKKKWSIYMLSCPAVQMGLYFQLDWFANIGWKLIISSLDKYMIQGCGTQSFV